MVVPSKEFIPIGIIAGVFGINGWVKVLSFTEPRENILNYSPLYILRKGERIEVQVSGTSKQGKNVIMELANITDRNQALSLIGAELAIKNTQLKPTEKDEYYWADLIGMTVVNLQNQVLGQVDHLLTTGAHDVLVVKVNSSDRERLIPFVIDQIVELVDLDNKRIRVDWEVNY